ncbi:MAG: hypothetical protein KDM63_21180, partial [Verrucomicrobiae bacterium]|nr:hypothetical protein [Verrucomicrobiae bacterium]
MNDRLANQILSYRSRLSCLDRDDHRPLWEDRPPLRFTALVAEARDLTAQLEDMAGRQSAPITGTTRQKKAKRRQLEDELFKVGRTFFVYCEDHGQLGQGAGFDLPRSAWLEFRDEALQGRA